MQDDYANQIIIILGLKKMNLRQFYECKHSKGKKFIFSYDFYNMISLYKILNSFDFIKNIIMIIIIYNTDKHR